MSIRSVRLLIAIAASIALVPWIAYLVHTLPHDYDCRNWRATWVGFDVLEVLCLAATAVLGFLHLHLVVLVSTVTGVLFLCDAWFDITTAAPHDVGWSVLTAVLAEIPLGVLFVGAGVHLHRRLVAAARNWEISQ